jgi:hypothetical protein
MHMPQTKPSSSKRAPTNQLEIAEVKRKLHHPFTPIFEKSYFQGKLMALESDKKTKWQHGTRQQTAMVLIQSTDIFDRAKGFGLVHDDPAISGDAVEWSNYTLKLSL